MHRNICDPYMGPNNFCEVFLTYKKMESLPASNAMQTGNTRTVGITGRADEGVGVAGIGVASVGDGQMPPATVSTDLQMPRHTGILGQRSGGDGRWAALLVPALDHYGPVST